MTEYAHARARDWRLDRPQQSRPPLQRWLTIWMKVVCAETLAMFTTLDSVYADPYIA